MRYVTHDGKKILHAFELDNTMMTISYPGFKTEEVAIDGKLWQNVVDNPEEYMLKNGKVLKIKP